MAELVPVEADATPTDRDVQQLIAAEKGEPIDGVDEGISRTWKAQGTNKVVLISDAAGVKISRDDGTTAPAAPLVLGSAAGGSLTGTYPNPGLAASPTFSGGVTTANLLVSGTLTLTGILAPPSFGTAQHNYNPTGLGTALIIELNPSAAVDVTGIATSGQQGRYLVLRNASATGSTITLKHDSASSVAGNRFYLPGAADFSLPFLQAIAFYYSTSAGGGVGRWVKAA